MVYTVKKPSNIAIQNKARFSVVFTHFSRCFFKPENSFVRTFIHSTRKRSSNKHWVKQRIQFAVYSVMEYSVTYRCFMNMSSFWVSDVKPFVSSVPIHLVSQISMKCKNMLLKPPLKTQYIFLLGFTTTKYFPRQKEILSRDYLVI